MVVPDALMPSRPLDAALGRVTDAGGRTARGGFVTVPLVVDAAPAIDADAVVVTSTAPFVMLGNTFLDDYVVEIDGARLILHPLAGPPPDVAGLTAVPLTYADGHLWVDVTVAGRDLRMMLDTGAGVSRWPADVLAAAGGRPAGAITTISGLGRRAEVPVVALDGVSLGGVRLEGVTSAALEAGAPVLGASALAGRRLVWSYGTGRLYVGPPEAETASVP